MNDNILSQLVINELTQTQYDEAKQNGLINPNELYLIKDGKLVIDEELSESSTNPVQNKIITEAINSKQNKITGTSGQFVVIGEDGNIATKTILIAEEGYF